MLLMDVRLDNVFGFEDFHINFSYPRKLINTNIGDEFLSARPNFKYKKAVVLMGGNATGKTTLGKALMLIFNYMAKGNPESLKDMIGDQSRKASFIIDFVEMNQLNLVRFKAVITASPDVVENYYSSCDIRPTDSYESCVKQLESKNMSLIQPSGFNSVFGNIGFRFCLAGKESILDNHVTKNKGVYLETLRNIIKTLDPSFVNISESKEFDDSFVLERGGTKILIQKGALQDSRGILSTGTREGISIATLVSAVRLHLNGFYYCDEMFSHIQTDIEKRLFGIMVDNLEDGEQLIFTSHNSDMQDLNLPKHSFVYLRKVKENGGFKIYANSASDYLKRPTDSVRCAAENDVFSTIPDDSLLDELE